MAPLISGSKKSVAHWCPGPSLCASKTRVYAYIRLPTGERYEKWRHFKYVEKMIRHPLKWHLGMSPLATFLLRTFDLVALADRDTFLLSWIWTNIIFRICHWLGQAACRKSIFILVNIMLYRAFREQNTCVSLVKLLDINYLTFSSFNSISAWFQIDRQNTYMYIPT